MDAFIATSECIDPVELESVACSFSCRSIFHW